MEEEYSRTSRKRKVPLRFLESSEAEDSSSEEIGGKKDLCKICGKKKAPQTKRKKGRDMWVACDICEFWFHVVCEGATMEEVKREVYICKDCCGKR